MEEKEILCPICGICDNDLQSHLSNHSKNEIIKAYSCKSEPNTSICNANSMNVAGSSSSNVTSNIKQTPNTTFTTVPNAYNTVFIPMNHPNYGMQAFPQPSFPIDVQQKAQASNVHVPNMLPVQNPMIYMPQYSNIIAPNMPTAYQNLLKDESKSGNLATQPLNVADPSFTVSSSPKVVQQPRFMANPGFPNIQQNPYQPMPMFSFYSPSIAPGAPNLSFCGNNIYAQAPVPTVVQFPGCNTMTPVNAAGFYPFKMQAFPSNLNPITQINNLTPQSQLNETATDTPNKMPETSSSPVKQCYYVGDKDALVSIGDDVKLILPKEILGKEELLGEFLREQLATAIATEVKSEAISAEDTIDQTIDLEASHNLESNWSFNNENTLSPSNCDFTKQNKVEQQSVEVVKGNIVPVQSKTEVYTDSKAKGVRVCVLDGETCLEVLEDEHELGTVEEILATEEQPIKQCFIVKSENEPDSDDEQKPRIIKVFSKNSSANSSKFDEENFLTEMDIKCVSECSDEIYTQHNSGLDSDVNIFDVIEGCQSGSVKSENIDVNQPEEKLSLKSSEILDHSDSESPCFMENTLQDLICIEEPGIQAMKSPKKISCSEFSISASEEQDQLHFTLDKDNALVMVSSSFVPNFLSPIKDEITLEREASALFTGEKVTKQEPATEDIFLEPFASTSGIPNKHSALNKSLEQEEYDFDYESDYFDSDSELYQSHKRGKLFQWECSKCQKSFKSLKEKLLHSGCHMEESAAKKEDSPEMALSPVKLEHTEDADLNEDHLHLDSKRSIEDDVLNQRIELLRNPLSCSFCFSIFPDQLAVSQHQKTHAISELKCTTCSKQIKSFFLWQEHQLFHYGASKHECKFCGRKFERRPLLNIHVRKHTGQKPYKCPTCGNKFSVRGSLKAHMMTHLKNQYAECDQCNKTFKNYSCVMRHKAKYHTQKKQTTFKKKQDHLCGTCYEVFPSERKLLWHQETHNRWPSKCKYCGECFVHQSGLTKHIRLKHNSKHVPDGQTKGVSVPCVVCRKMYTASSLVLHMRTHNGYKPFKCIVCGKQFSVKCNLTNHMWVHAGTKDRPYRCNLCDKSYSRKKFLESHVRSHKKIKPFTCNECGKSFAYKHNLNSHMKQHFGEKEHLCSYCGKAFFRKYNLKDHVRVHTGETPFSCAICNKEFTQKSNYNVHIKAFHVERHVLDEEI